MPDKNHQAEQTNAPEASGGILLPDSAELKKREDSERQRRQDDDHQLLILLQKKQADAQALQAKSNVVIACLTAGLVVVSIIGGIVSYLQFSAAKESAKAATSAARTADETLKESRRSFKQEQRAYLSASSFGIRDNPLCDIPNAGVRACADVHIVNSGRTPAIGVHIHRYATFGKQAEQTIRAMKIPDDASPFGDVLGLTGDKWGTAATDPIDEKTLKGIADGSISLYVYGVVQYFDVFNDYHETGYCSQRLPNKGPFIVCTFGNWFDKRPDSTGSK